MILDDVANGARFIIKGASALDPEIFRHRDLHALHVGPVPEDFGDRVRKAKIQQVLDRPFPEIMIDPEDRVLRKYPVQQAVQLPGAREVRAERLLDDDTPPARRVLLLCEPGAPESRDRVRSAIRNSGFPFPPGRVTVSLTPSDLRKVGAAFDLPIALGILAAAGVLPTREPRPFTVIGGLSLDGHVPPMAGLLPGRAALQPRLTAIGLQAVELPEGTLRGHTFHHAQADITATPLAHATNPNGAPSREAVYRDQRMTASFVHFYFPSQPDAAMGLFLP